MNPHLQQFTQQLASWAENIIDTGRVPFRRIDTFPRIMTRQGWLRPPLVLWINRQSLMSGGIILTPENNLEKELEHGCHCAEALGLSYFVTWEANQVRIWQVKEAQAVEYRNLDMTNPEQPETFRNLLEDLFDELKMLAVLGVVPVPELSSYYLCNLYLATLDQARPALMEAWRSQRSEADHVESLPTNQLAEEANRLLLLQILALLWHGQLPEAILPEKITRAVELSLSRLPQDLAKVLALPVSATPPPLPGDSAVGFHHLILRLKQLSWTEPADRVHKSIADLIGVWYPSRGENLPDAKVYLYPACPPLNRHAGLLVSRSAAFLAATIFLCRLTETPRPKVLFGNLMQLGREDLPEQTVYGRLQNSMTMTNPERQEFSTRLRTAWPNRHLKITAGQPFWMWELVHLLGLAHDGQRLLLHLPCAALTTDVDHPIWTILHEHFSLCTVRLNDDRTVDLEIKRDEDRPESLTVLRDDKHRQVPFLETRSCFRSHILLALGLPEDIYPLLGHDLVWLDQATDPEKMPVGWEDYGQSRLCHWLQSLLAGDSSTRKPEEQLTLAYRNCIPVPDPLLLQELAAARQKDPAGPAEHIDQLLAKLLNCQVVATLEPPTKIKPTQVEGSGGPTGKKLKDNILQQLQNYGIPGFPEQYLYFLEQPEMLPYQFQPPLQLKHSVLGQFELEDSEGQVIEGYGAELEQTLLICAQQGKTRVDLPRDRNQLDLLLSYYKKDLNALYKYLKNLCYSQVDNTKSARKLVGKVWNKLDLPDPQWFKKK